ncbi:DUF2520 domain-containing protein [Mesoterricola sediminis]|uniref:DUF2520 domain-containing protein n=1 Tax=Mesoterricola sediminis TaxID=2927980 RepID=A0AA48KC18_9BACT|nr:DUF2520 domain-containing protein [Mesoterricola sediminis]BDU76699.1 hypothetical protein METESE_16570 [Mesoterricola sediminis]
MDAFRTFSVLGRGRAGRALAEAWAGRHPLLPGSARPGGLVLLALPDRALAEAAAAFPGRCVHLSGSLHLPGVPCAHPLVSFDGRPADWHGAPLALTGEVPAVILEAFTGLGFAPFQLPPDLKPLYHACAVLASGHVATLWLGARARLAEAGVDLPGRAYAPLAESTLRNIEAHGAGGRTGPFVRGDRETIERDAAALGEPWRSLFLQLGSM